MVARGSTHGPSTGERDPSEDLSEVAQTRQQDKTRQDAHEDPYDVAKQMGIFVYLPKRRGAPAAARRPSAGRAARAPRTPADDAPKWPATICRAHNHAPCHAAALNVDAIVSRIHASHERISIKLAKKVVSEQAYYRERYNLPA